MDGRKQARHRRVAALCLVLAGVAFSAYLPHWNPSTGQSQLAPIHLDEYVHWGYSRAIVDQGRIDFVNPFKSVTLDFTLTSHLHERGYQAWLGVLQATSGIPFVQLLQFLPVVAAILLSLATFSLCEKWGAGVEAALWVAAIPTTLRFLGPGFAVPIAASLPLVVFCIHLLAHKEGARRLWALLIIAFALWTIHAMAAAAVLTITLIYALFLVRAHPLLAGAAAVTVALPGMLAYPYYSLRVLDGVWTPGLPASLDDLRLMGSTAFALATVGCAALALDHSRRTRRSAGVVGIALALAVGVLVARNVTGDDVFGIYDRTAMIAYTLVAITAGVGIVRTRAVLIRSLTRLRVTGAGAVVVAALLFVQGAAIAQTIAAEGEKGLYVVVTPRELESFEQAAQALGPEHTRAVVDGISSLPFSIVTGRPNLFPFMPDGQHQPEAMEAFWARNAADTYLLVELQASVVVTGRSVENPDLTQIAPGVYVLRPEYVVGFEE